MMNIKWKTKILLALTGCFVLAFMAGAIAGSNDSGYTTVEVKNGGTITGSITFGGELAKATEIKVTKDAKVCGQVKADESLVVDEKTKGIRNVVVFLKNVKSGKGWQSDKSSLAIDQKGCQFTPHVLVVPAGQAFNILNNDGILHNIHTRSEINSSVNKAQPRFMKKMKLSFDSPEFIKVACDVHNWMQGWIVVAANPYYVVTNETGGFELTDVPAGTYEVEVWHEKLGHQVQTVEVKAGDVTTVNAVLQ